MNHLKKIYISYDSTNKNCQVGDIEIVEYGRAIDDKSLPVFNYAITKLGALCDQKKTLQIYELASALEKSVKSYEEVLKIIKYRKL